MNKLIIILTLISYVAIAHGQASINETHSFVLDSAVKSTIAGELVTKIEYKYNESELRLSEIYYDWNSDANAWDNRWMTEYDTGDNNIFYVSYLWNENTNTFEQSNKYEYEKNLNNNQLSYIYYNWYDYANEWQEITKIEYQYDDNNRPTTFISLYHDYDVYRWMPHSKHSFQYDANDNVKLYLFYIWDPYINAWKENSKIEYEYDALNRQILYVMYNLNKNTQMYEEHQKQQTIYDTHNNPVLKTIYHWNKQIAAWTADYEERFYYSVREINNTLSQHGVQSDGPKTPINQPTIPLSEPVASVDNMSNSIVFPNPASDYITIRGAATSSITVFDISGRIVFRKDNIGEDETVSVSAWRIGAYLVSVEKGNERIVHKLIKH